MFGNYRFGKITQDKIEHKRRMTKGKLSYHDNSDKIIKIKKTNPETGITVSQDMRLAVLKPTTSYMPTKNDVMIYKSCPSVSFIRTVLGSLKGVIAVDIETRGTRAHLKDDIIIGIGIASADKIIYLDINNYNTPVKDYIYNWLVDYSDPIIGHNIFFDGAFLKRETGKWLNWKACTYGMYRQLASEGYAGQKWGLKDAQIQLLNYDSKGDVELDMWLINNDYIADIKKDEKPGYYKINYQDKGERWAKPRKEEMWRAPAEILGYYCGVDAASTYQLFSECFMPSIKDEPFEEMFLRYHDIFVDNVRILVNQQLSGITIDKDKLEEHHAYLLGNISNHTDDFLNHPKVRPHATAYNELKIQELIEKEPTKYLKQKVSKEPARYRKDGEESLVWKKWKEKQDKLKEEGPQLTSHWKTWNDKLALYKNMEHLNINSGPQMQWLFYDRLGFPIIMHTKSGQPSTGTDALPGFGEVGRLLKKQKDDTKEESYVSACLEHLVTYGENEYRIHPQFRCPGTLTGRLAGSGGINLQQLPKSRKYLECWYPTKEGKVWIDYDICALEQVVLAELSRDESLLSLYGPNAKPNDVYLYNAALMSQKFNVKLFDPIIESGYDPFNPDKDIISKVKKQHKSLRAISKVASLGKAYGMGWKKFQLNMKIQGIDMTESECRAVIEGLDKVYSGVKKYQYHLEKEYRKNNGYIISGLGTPVGCAEDYLKDIVSRTIQRTGHDILMIYISIFDQLLNDAGINYSPIIADFHDESLIECDAKDAEAVCRILEIDAPNILNQELGGIIPLKFEGGIVKTFAEAKLED